MFVKTHVTPGIRSHTGLRLPFPSARCWRFPAISRARLPLRQEAANDLEVDIVIVGAGIIGLSIAYSLLERDASVTVAISDQSDLCTRGATGAGVCTHCQGYIWLAHRQPQSAAWELAVRSKQLWEDHFLTAQTNARHRARQSIEWQETGSMLLARDSMEGESLVLRAQLLRDAGLEATCCSSSEAEQLEPGLCLPPDGAALLLPRDAQLNGSLAAHYLAAACRAYRSRCKMFLREGAAAVDTDMQSGDVRACGITTGFGRRVLARRGVVVAAGSWSGQLLEAATGDSMWGAAFSARRGHLLEVVPPAGMPPLKHGLMEASYTKHYSTVEGTGGQSTAPAKEEKPLDITFTATTSATGRLLLGSSRELSWDQTPAPAVTQAILAHARKFLPALGSLTAANVRVGLRPQAVRGTPVVGPISGVSGLWVAAGHEGSGLTLAPITAQIVSDYILNGTSTTTGANVLLPTPLSV